MSIQDGFGDRLTPDEVGEQERRIADFEKWAHAVANDMLGSPAHPDHDDLVQEARIGIWRAARSHDRSKGAFPSYATQAARWAMNDAVQRQKWTGQETTRGVKVTDRNRPTASLDQLVDETGISLLLEAVDVLDQVLAAYHHGEIVQAIENLPAAYRDYVYLRFWHGLSGPEIAAKTDIKPSLQRFYWTKKIVPYLRTELAHLGAS